MNRSEAKKNANSRGDVNTMADQTLAEHVEDPSVENKLLNNEAYNKEDMAKCATQILTEAGFDHNKCFKIFEQIKDFEPISPDVKTSFYICSKPKPNRWVVFCLLRKETGSKILYKDSSTKQLPKKLENGFKKKLENVEIVINQKREHKADDDHLYGPFCLRNLKMFLERIKKDEKKFEEDFIKTSFTTAVDPAKIRLDDVFAKTKSISENSKFKEALKKFFDNLPLDVVSNNSLKEYNQILEDEMKKEEPDYQKIAEARKKAYDEKYLDDIKKKCEVSKNSDDTEYVVEIEKDYPNEMDTLKDIFKHLSKMKVDEEFHKALETISKQLDIDSKKLQQFYTTTEETPTFEEELTPLNIEEIDKNCPKPTNTDVDTSDCTPFEKLLKEVFLGMDSQDPSEPISDQARKDKRQLEKQFHTVKAKMMDWEEKSLRDINEWARKIKGRLGTTAEDICEAIAVMDQAFCLLTGGFHLRNTQILAVLIFMKGSDEMGRLCQIQTGEGKTNIVSFIAVIKTLQGNTVDVITSNAVLAADGVKETEKFYSVFNLTVSHNNPPEDGSVEKIGYKADVLYGTISNFQFDYLRDSFEGMDIRNNRKFGQVVLDEVDSMLVDNGGHIAKLAAPFPGMECLRYIYIKIWQELNKAEKKFIEEKTKKLEEILKDPDEETRELRYERFILETTHKEKEFLKDEILKNDPTNIPFIPNHLKDYVKCKLKIWVDKAIYARYDCHEHRQYRLITDDNGEKIVAPVDYLNTGVTMKNTIWSDGLHQFIQLKHNLYLTFESLTSSFISNIGYIRKYDSKNIFGLTGTLGSRAEQELLSGIYNIDYAKLPTYTEKKFEELEGIVAPDDSWATKITLEVLRKVDEERAVLLICETEQDLMMIEDNLKILQGSGFRIRKYANEDYAQETQEKVKIGDVILATNIAGRGTNFKTEKELEEKGGLHVCVGFLPCNLRVEGQAFGRTSRQGNKGTAQLIIRQSEVEELETSEYKDFAEVKKARDVLERKRLENIKEELVKELDFKDELFKKFSQFYKKLMDNHESDEDSYAFKFILNDLKEFWAFWLEKKNFTAKTINIAPEEAFRSFKKEASIIAAGVINHNPLYAISLAEYYMEMDDADTALVNLKHAQDIAQGDLAGLHMKLFEVAILNGHQTKERVKTAVGKIFGINIKKNENYKNDAKQHLQKARDAINQEIDYFNGSIMNLIEDEAHFVDDFQNILVEDEKNSLVKHLCSRISALKTQEGSITKLLEDCQEMKGGIALGGKAPMEMQTLKTIDQNVEDAMTAWELSELQSIGLDSLYCLREVKDVPDAIIHTAQGEIIAGITLLTLGICFPPFYVVVSGQAADLISGAIIDLVVAVVWSDDEFNKKEFFKAKFRQYGQSLLSLGFAAVKQCVSILDKAIEFCNKLSKALKSAKHMKKVCEGLAHLVEKLGKYLEKLKELAELNKLGKAEQLAHLKKMDGKLLEELKLVDQLKKLERLEKAGKLMSHIHTQLFADCLLHTAAKLVTKSVPIIEGKIVAPMRAATVARLANDIENKVSEELKNSIKENPSLVEKLRTSDPEDTNEAVVNFIKMGKIKELTKKCSPKLLGMLKSKLGAKKTSLLKLGLDAAIETSELVRCLKDFTKELDEALHGGNCNNDVDEMIDDVCEDVAGEVAAILQILFTEGVQALETELTPSEDKCVDIFKKLGLSPDASPDAVTDKLRMLKLKLKAQSLGGSFNDGRSKDLEQCVTKAIADGTLKVPKNILGDW